MEQATQNPRAIEVWWNHINGNTMESQAFVKALIAESPSIVSAVMERTCNLQCLHCIFGEEKSSKAISQENNLSGVIRSMVWQMPEAGTFLHTGRIMQSWHIDVMAGLRELRSDIALGAIDNGSFTRLMSQFEKTGLCLDFLDVSIDGDEQSHNAQRGSTKAYAMARAGIQKARRVAHKVTSLMALSKLNAHSVKRVVEELLVSGEVDELHFSPVLPYREGNALIGMEASETLLAFSQLASVVTSTTADRIHYRIYDVNGLEKLARVVGTSELRDAILAGVMDHGCLVFHVHGVEVSYYPLSLWPQEEVAIDADGGYRVAGYAKYSLNDLKENTNAMGYTIGMLTPQSDLVTMYARCVRQYWRLYGKAHLQKEVQVIRGIMA